MNPICFDLEGPLTPEDNAYELMKLIPEGDKLFQIISRYDDLLTLEDRADYEPGDTLALIAPFLASAGITEEQITNMGRQARLTPGAEKLITKLKSHGWEVFCISTSYQQYAFAVTQRLGIPQEQVACTYFPLEPIRRLIHPENLSLLKEITAKIANLAPFVDDNEIKKCLDQFYWQELPQTELGKIIAQVKPIGGKRKVQMLENFSTKVGRQLSYWVAVGDSITDFNMLHAVNKAGGLSIAFNANEYALSYCTLALASVNLEDLWAVLEAWAKGGREAVKQMVKEKERTGGIDNREHFHWLDGEKISAAVIEIHRRIRHLVRGEAAKLG